MVRLIVIATKVPVFHHHHHHHHHHNRHHHPHHHHHHHHHHYQLSEPLRFAAADNIRLFSALFSKLCNIIYQTKIARNKLHWVFGFSRILFVINGYQNDVNNLIFGLTFNTIFEPYLYTNKSMFDNIKYCN
jgi:G3E family GTPase